MDKDKILTKSLLIAFYLSVNFSVRFLLAMKELLYSNDNLQKRRLNQMIGILKWTAITISPNTIWHTNATGYNHVYFCIVR